MTIKLLLNCRTFLFAEGLRRLMEDHDGFQFVGISSSDKELLELLRNEPDIILTDNLACIEAVHRETRGRPPKILLLCENNSLFIFENLRDLVLKGLAGVMDSRADSRLLRKAIIKVYSGDLWIDHKTINNSICSSSDRQLNFSLTKKEKQVLDHICSGHTNKRIAQDLCISEQTVKSHCNRLYKKFGVKNRLSLAVFISQYKPSCNS